MTDFKRQIRDWYEADLTKIVTRHNGNQGPRVRKPMAYTSIPEPEHPRQVTSADKVWVSSDQHFNHKNIIEFSDRPFVDLPTMNQAIIDNHNDYVEPNDIWLCVGDISFCGIEETRRLVNQMNGYKILIVGNHDIRKKNTPDLGFDEVHLLYYIDANEVGLVFTHFPMFNLPKPLINIHGHLHRYFDIDSMQHINVCCEFHGFKPVPLETLVQWAKHRASNFNLLPQTCLVCDNKHAHLEPINKHEIRCPFCEALFNLEDFI